MNEVTMTILILRVLIRALGILLWERRRWTSLDSTRKKTLHLLHTCRCVSENIQNADQGEEKKVTPTVSPSHAAGYLNKDSCVAEDHDDQRKEEEAHKSEHVVEGLLPALHKTAMGGALSEVLWDCDGYIVKYEHLHVKDKE